MDVEREALKRARTIYERLQLKGEFEQADFVESLYEPLADLSKGALVALVHRTAEKIDREAISGRDDETPMLPGFELEGVYALGKGRRIAKRLATKLHWQQALAIHDANLRNDMRANLRKHEEFDKLIPYMAGEDTKEMGVAAYQRANPEG
jgi:hypothetical protein